MGTIHTVCAFHIDHHGDAMSFEYKKTGIASLGGPIDDWRCTILSRTVIIMRGNRYFRSGLVQQGPNQPFLAWSNCWYDQFLGLCFPTFSTLNRIKIYKSCQ